MNTKKSSGMSFCIVASILLLFAVAVRAQEQRSEISENSANTQQNSQALMIVATVNIYEATIVSQSGNNFKIGFDISNRQNVQTGVRYAVQLQKIVNDQFANVADQKVFPETLTLNQGVTLHREVDYQAPSFLNGDYEVWVISKLDNGLLLALQKAGTIKLNGNGEFAEILSDTCYLTVDGDNNKYTPPQGVDIAETETLRATCDAKNGFKADITAVPQIELRRRSDFGETVSVQKLSAISFKSLEQKQVNLVVPKPDKPQVYEAILTFLDSSGQTVSNATNFHFVLRGESATIQNLTLNGDYYQKGDIATVFFVFTPSADSFPEARGEGTKMDDVILKLDIKDKDGALCGSTTETFSIEKPAKTQLDVPIGAACVGAVAVANLTDKDGNVLDSTIPKVQTEEKEPAAPETMKNKQLMTYIIIFAVLVFLSAIGLMMWKKRKNRDRAMGLMLLFFTATMIFFARGVSADTVCQDVGMHVCCMSQCITANIDKIEYLPKETVTATASASSWTSCNNVGFSSFQVDATINKQTRTIISRTRGGTNIPNRSANFTAEDASGTYNARFVVYWGGGGIEQWTSDYIDIPYDVVGSPIALDLKVLPYCTNENVAFTWRFRDPDNKPQSKFRLQVFSNSNYSSPVIDTGEITSTTSSYIPPQNKLNPDRTYYWRIMVWNSDGVGSGWINGSSFVLSAFLNGNLDFSWTPANPKVGDRVYFLSNFNPCYYDDYSGLVCPGLSNYPCYYDDYSGLVCPVWRWNWSFQNGIPRSSNALNPDVLFSAAGQNSVYLELIDLIGNICAVPKTINVTASNQPPTATPNSPIQPNYCFPPTSIALSWLYTDPDNDRESKFQLQIANDSGFSSVIVDRTFDNLNNRSGSVNNQSVLVSSSPAADQIGYNKTYYWRVMVWDARGLASSWVTGQPFSTPAHVYPAIDFTWQPSNPDAKEQAFFTDKSTVFGGATKASWAWTFQNGSPNTSSDQNPTVIFNSSGSWQISLKLTDSNGLSCIIQKALKVNLPFPAWKEIKPF